MATTLELLLEAEKRGILEQIPQEKVELLSEARNRGLVPSSKQKQAQPSLLEQIATTSRQPGAVMAATMFGEGAPFVKAVKEGDFPIGATVGGLVGAGIGAGVTGASTLGIGTPAGAVIGGGLGAAFGESMEQMARRALGLDAPETPLEAAKEIGKEGAIGAGAEFGGQVAVRVAGKLIAPFKKSVSTEAEKVINFFKNKTRQFGLTKKRVSPLFPAQATDITERSGAAGILDFFHNIADNSIIGSNEMRRVAKQNLDVVSETADDLIRSFSKQNLTSEQMGVTLNAVLKGNLKVEREASDVLYNTINEMVKDKSVTKRVGKKLLTVQALGGKAKEKIGIVNIGSIKGFAGDVQKLSNELKGFGAGEQGFDTVAQILKFNDNLSFEAAKNARTTLLNMAKNRTLEGKTDPAVGLARNLAGQLDQAIEVSLKTHAPKALKLWRKANRAYKATSEQYDNRLIRGIFDMANRKKGGNPEDIISHVFKPGAITNIKRIKRAVDNETWGKVKNLFTRNLLKKSSIASEDLVSKGVAAADVKGGSFMLQGSQLKEALSGMGKDILHTVYTPKELVTLKAVASAMDLSQKTVGHGLGRMFIQLSQAGAIIGILSGKAAGLGIPLVVGPGLLSRVFTNPTTAKWLIQGYKLPANSPQLARVMSRLSASLIEMEAQDVKRRFRGKGAPSEKTPAVP